MLVKRIQFAMDASGCPKCEKAYHKGCLAEQRCPACGLDFVEYEKQQRQEDERRQAAVEAEMERRARRHGGSAPSTGGVIWAAVRIVAGIAIMLVPLAIGIKAGVLALAGGGWLLGGGIFDLIEHSKR